MKNTLKAIVALVLCSATAFAASEARKPRPVACEDFSLAKTSEGASYAVCVSANGKPSVLRSFAVVSVTDPDGKAVRVAVGFR